MEDTVDSPVGRMFEGRSVFITGASGFIGRVLLEKLLSTYSGIKRIYILLRSKKNQKPHDRLHQQLLSTPIFDRIRARPDGQELLAKIDVLPGDIGEPWLGLSDLDLARITSDSSLAFVFHSAATIKFDEPLKLSVQLNLIATKTVIDICKRLDNLISLCHVSTAYANGDITDNSDIEEKLYPMREKPEHLIKLAEMMDTQAMQELKLQLIDKRPNTYTYTKALAEHLIAQEAQQLPVAIVRPSIVAAAWRQPLPGWIDNLNGPTGLILSIGKGLLRTLHVTRASKADIVPVDITVNTMIAAAYYTARSHNKLADPKETEESKQQQANQEHQLYQLPRPHIFHCNSGDLNGVTWGQIEDTVFPIIKHYPSNQVLRYPFGTFKGNKYHDLITRLFVHYLPALILDSVCVMMGKKRRLYSIYQKLHCAVSALAHFTNQNYNFKTRNIRHLKAALNDHDCQELYMDVTKMDWIEYWHGYVLGCRRFILKESDDSLDEARRSFKRAYYIEIALRSVLALAAGWLTWPLLAKFAIASESLAGSIIR